MSTSVRLLLYPESRPMVTSNAKVEFTYAGTCRYLMHWNLGTS